MAEQATTDETVDEHPAYRYVGSEVRSFPTIGVYNVAPGDVFHTHHAVASPDIEHEDGTPTYVAIEVAEATEPAADYTLEDLTKAELVDLAQDLDLHGRSQMTKPELIAALREAAQVTPEEQAAAEAAIDKAVSHVGQTETNEAAGGADETEE